MHTKVAQTACGRRMIMARPNQRQKALSKEQSKVRVLAIYRMLLEGRRLTSSEIMRRLYSQYDMKVDRKTIYSDIYSIDRIVPISVMTGRYGGYMKCDFSCGGASNE
jgi:hypothetical protein